MARHVLSLEVPDTMNKSILRIMDTSIYAENLDVTCPLLQVTLPGFTTPENFESPQITEGFALNLTACDLSIQNTECGTRYWDLPDGIYIIKYSVSPNDLVYVEYNHLRITQALWKYNNLLCEMDYPSCEPSAAMKDKLNTLRLAKTYLDAAKAKVEYCHQPDRGMLLYNYALKILNKLDCKNC
jgi:hypothetical protein